MSASASDAYQVALQHGAKDEDIQKLRTREALMQILQEANIEEDICEDVVDACDISNLDALAIASGLFTVNEVADTCFLTKDEAEVCLFYDVKCFDVLARYGHCQYARSSIYAVGDTL